MSVLGIRQVLLAEPDVSVVGEARAPRDVVSAARSLRPDVLLLARSFSGTDAGVLIRDVRAALAVAVLVLSTGWESHADPLEPLWAGASGLLVKADLATRLGPAVRDVAAGGVVLDPRLARAVVDRLRDGAAPPDREVLGRLGELTGRERDVLRALGRPGASNRDIAGAMGISPLTVKAHVRRILAKLAVADRREAGRTARYLDDELHPRRRAAPQVRPGRTGSAPGA